MTLDDPEARPLLVENIGVLATPLGTRPRGGPELGRIHLDERGGLQVLVGADEHL